MRVWVVVNLNADVIGVYDNSESAWRKAKAYMTECVGHEVVDDPYELYSDVFARVVSKEIES